MSGFFVYYLLLVAVNLALAVVNIINEKWGPLAFSLGVAGLCSFFAVGAWNRYNRS